MAKRRKVALRYEYDERWIGGTYYIQNLIAALDHLPDHKKPDLQIFTGEDINFVRLKDTINYPYLSRGTYLKKLNIFKKLINKITRQLNKRDFFSALNSDLHVVFPAGNEGRFKKDQKYLYWIPDFQEHFLPDFFSKEEIESRLLLQKNIVSNGRNIVFSSQSTKRDFNSLYPGNNLQQFVLPFAVTHPPLTFDPVPVRAQYRLPAQYYICCNQFWQHKNHLVVLRAVALLKKDGIAVTVVFTGKEYNAGESSYFDNLKKLVSELKIECNVIFLGFISREHQLTLMKASLAVIQPSLFEGWSTVIEDAKALNATIVASAIPVHYEQLQKYGTKCFFQPSNEEDLGQCIQKSKAYPGKEYHYENDVINYADTFLHILNSIEK